ncbi:MAG: hypothetical protein HOP11_01540 [Saprospiraceae bacterium]|nr:hypothetical protein [Saprospiraceae bacterium]
MSLSLYSQNKILLVNNWEYKAETDSIWRPCAIPNSIYSILIKDKLIQDPFFGNHEEQLQNIGKQNYLFKTQFQIGTQQLETKSQNLILNGVDTYAEIFLNNQKISTCNSAFQTWRLDVKPFLNHGNNELIIKFNSSELQAQKEYSTLNPALPGGERVMIRKPQYHFGWDFGPKYTGCGLLDIPYLECFSNLVILNHSVHTVQLHSQYAEIELVLEIQSLTENSYSIQWTLDNQLFVNSLLCKEGTNFYRFRKKIKNPKLWWPNGSGQAYLYDTRLLIINNEKETVFLKHFNTGIRVIKLITRKDKWGSSFYFNVNGQPIFCKGANYVPQSIFQNRSQNHEEILRDAYQCNFNMLRVWGGGNYESDSFYETCDRLGIMIWQDFMYACAMYPGTTSFLNDARTEADEQVKRLSRFASIALWCGNNENNEAWHRWGWQIGLSSDTKDRLWNDYKRLFLDILQVSVASYSNNHSYWESSPLYGRGDSRFNTEGDAHDWGVWHDEMKFEAFEDRVPRFMSEAGFQSIPSMTTVQSFATLELLSLESPALLAHQKHPRGNKLILQYLNHDLPAPKDFEALIYLNQLNQAEGIGIGIKAHRRAKPYCMGTLYWQFNDCWPGISWSSRDYFGRWKALQHKTKELFQPILITTRESGSMYEIFASSDIPKNTPLKIDISFIANDTTILLHENLDFSIQSNYSGRVFSFDLEKYKNKYSEDNALIYIQWEYNDFKSYSIHFLTKLKKVKLQKPNFYISNFEQTPLGYEFEITSDHFAKGVYIKEEKDIQFFPNYFDLAPNRATKIKCKTPLKTISPEFFEFVSLFDHL